MRYGVLSGLLWGLDTVVIGIGLAMAPYIGTPAALAFAALAGAFLHDVFCAVWLYFYMGLKHRLHDTLTALKTRSGKIVMLGALLGGPVGMTGYVIAISHIGPAYTAIISAFYPAFGTLLAFLILRERMTYKQFIALGVALIGVMVMGYSSAGASAAADNPVLGLCGALVCVLGWGSEAVLCAWGMRDDAVDNETALQIRETTSAMVYACIVLPMFGAWAFTSSAFLSLPTTIIALAGLAGAASYLCYYKAIDTLGAARAMAVNISYSAWSVVFGMVLLGAIPSMIEIVCCIAIMCGTVLAACDVNELFPIKRSK